MICMLTATDIKIKIILKKIMFIIKKTEYKIVSHNKEIDKIFAFSGIPFPSM